MITSTRQFLSVIVIVGLLTGSCKQQNSDSFYMPAEWEEQEAVWFGWEEYDSAYYPVVARIINNLTPHVRVNVAVNSDSLKELSIKTLLKFSVDTSQVTFYTMKGERYWIRDHGAAFLVNEKGGLAVADFDWSMYGLEDWYKDKYDNNEDSVKKYMKRNFEPATGSVDSLMAAAENASIIKSDIVIEGGAFEVNGKGTLILCEAVAMQRNSHLTKEEIEVAFKKSLGVSKIIWMKKGLIEDAHIRQLHLGKFVTMGTGGHTDEFVRFVDPHTILLSWVDEDEIDQHPLNKINYDRMSENYEILKSATDQDGKPFEIIKVPLPGPIERKIIVKEKLDRNDRINMLPRYFIPRDRPKVGDTLINIAAASYLNYLVSNGVVILPTYLEQGSSVQKEKEVLEIFKAAFPGRELVWVECMPQNWDGGGIHCSSQQQPRRRNKN